MPRTRVARDVLSALDSASPGVAQHAALTAASCHATASPGQKPAAPLLPVLEGGVACARRRRQQAQQRADLAGVPPGGADSLVQQLQLLSRAGAFLAHEAEEEREVAARAEARAAARAPPTPLSAAAAAAERRAARQGGDGDGDGDIGGEEGEEAAVAAAEPAPGGRCGGAGGQEDVSSLLASLRDLRQVASKLA